MNECLVINTNTHIYLYIYYQGRLYSQQRRRYSPNFRLFPSFPSFSTPPSPSFPSCREAAPLKPVRRSGECYKLPQWGLGQSPSRHRFWCILRGKNSFDSNYYMDFCILKLVKLLVKFSSPKMSLTHLSPTIDRDVRHCLHTVSQRTAHFVFAYIFDTCQPMFIIFSRRAPEEICNKIM